MLVVGKGIETIPIRLNRLLIHTSQIGHRIRTVFERRAEIHFLLGRIDDKPRLDIDQEDIAETETEHGDEGEQQQCRKRWPVEVEAVVEVDQIVGTLGRDAQVELSVMKGVGKAVEVGALRNVEKLVIPPMQRREIGGEHSVDGKCNKPDQDCEDPGMRCARPSCAR